MKPYKNVSGHSGVVSYDIKPDAIHIVFRDGEEPNYLYDAASAGRTNLEAMKRLAQAGRGLSTFISRNVRDGYARKW